MSERDIVVMLRRRDTGNWYKLQCEAADEIERLRSAAGETGASVPTRTSEQGLSYHDGTEALREALEEISNMGCENWPDGHTLTCRCNPCIARRALSQHVGGEG